ncbi:beta-N-acetylhexosaminidase [Streptomyces sp. H10-C2]|uniref:beta-N-acetylhexosaminidase n=1 Tax=Streptomyces sp. H10-C2 TaxID=3046210 RepID=UPI0024BBC4BA|nr:beta-N-acetylhexosaminidase [Streptomyces sp. H10-C2]MDJ0369337.1 beta-N-acetylhexosaminidase [Streptomyces sp. H10-C2]
MRRPSVRNHLPQLLCALLLVTGAAGATAPTAPAASSDGSPSVLERVVPAPASVRSGGASYSIRAGTRIHVPRNSEAARAIGDYLAGALRPSTGYRVPVVADGGHDGIVLRLGTGGNGGNGGAWEAWGGDATGSGSGSRSGSGSGSGVGSGSVGGGKSTALGAEGYRLDVSGRSVTLSAVEAAGLFHGVQTLRQLLPAAIEKHSAQRGPWTVPGGTITDAPRYAYRGGMLDVSRHFFSVAQVERYIDQLALYKINQLHLHLSDDQGWRIAIASWPRLATYGGSTQVGGGPGGVYSQDDYREIVRYAASRFLTVVPEIDMPGHTNAVLASYAELNCTGVASPLYTGTNVGFSSLCVPKDITYRFADQVLRELAALTPGPYLHIGGDEALSTSHADYVTFMEKVQPIVTKYGKTVIGWHQLAGAHPVKGAIAQYWGKDGSEKEVAEAAKAGTRLILSPANRSYLDMKYNASTPLGKDWAGLVEVKDSYNWDPATLIKGAPASAVLGVEAPLWNETIVTSADAEYMTFPRLPGIAELGWSPPATHQWNAYKVRLAAQGPRWTALGITYYRSPQVPWPSQ